MKGLETHGKPDPPVANKCAMNIQYRGSIFDYCRNFVGQIGTRAPGYCMIGFGNINADGDRPEECVKHFNLIVSESDAKDK